MRKKVLRNKTTKEEVKRVDEKKGEKIKVRGARHIADGAHHDYYDNGEYYQMIRNLPGVYLVEDHRDYVAPYSVNANDLLALESQQERNVAAAAAPTTPGSGYNQIPSSPQQHYSPPYDEQLAQPLPLENGSENKQFSTIQQQSFAYDFEQPLDIQNSDTEFQDKTIKEVRQAVGGLFRGRQQGGGGGFGPDGRPLQGEDNGLVQAALPVAIAGFVALAFSSIFANHRQINSTSNEDTPWLWQIPINFEGDVKKRRRRSDDDDDDDYNEIEDDGDDGSIIANSSKYVQRFKDGILLYSMMEADADCRMKIACVFGERTRRSDHKSLIQTLVRTFMPKSLRDFTDQFLVSSRSSYHSSHDNNNNNNCSAWKCSKCFSI